MWLRLTIRRIACTPRFQVFVLTLVIFLMVAVYKSFASRYRVRKFDAPGHWDAEELIAQQARIQCEQRVQKVRIVHMVSKNVMQHCVAFAGNLKSIL